MADGNGKSSDSEDQPLVSNQLTTATNMNNNAGVGVGVVGGIEAKIKNGPTEVSDDNKGITCAERGSIEARSSHALNKVSYFKYNNNYELYGIKT